MTTLLDLGPVVLGDKPDMPPVLLFHIDAEFLTWDHSPHGLVSYAVVNHRDPDDYYYNAYHPDGFSQVFVGKYTNPDITKLVESAQAERDFAKRKSTYQEVERLVQEDAGGILSYRLSLGFAWRTNVKGFKTSVRGDFTHASGGILGMTKS